MDANGWCEIFYLCVVIQFSFFFGRLSSYDFVIMIFFEKIPLSVSTYVKLTKISRWKKYNYQGKDYVSLNHHKYDECMRIQQLSKQTPLSNKEHVIVCVPTTILICFDCSIHLVAHKDNIFCSIGPKNVWCMHNQIF
jgi:hypothetical protein